MHVAGGILFLLCLEGAETVLDNTPDNLKSIGKEKGYEYEKGEHQVIGEYLVAHDPS